ncbi:MAG: NUDIX domain-containing protein [Lachnospiraceae bacterium]|nr:NUDIX domain-containing protein [Lachnospiraceae bacterium]
MQIQCEGALRSMTSLYLFQGDRVLLLYRQGSRVANEVWIGSAGGHFEAEEQNDAKACVLRELREELGLFEEDLAGLRLGYVTLRRIGGEIRQNYYFFAELKAEPEGGLVSNEGRLQWFSFEDRTAAEL